MKNDQLISGRRNSIEHLLLTSSSAILIGFGSRLDVIKYQQSSKPWTLCAIGSPLLMKQIAIFIIFISKSSLSQANEGYITWDSSNRLTIEDFQPRKADSTHVLYNGAFIIYFQPNVFKFGYNYNKNVKAQMIKSGSWLDTTTYPRGQLRVLQDEFDIYEIYARHFRKMLNNEHNLNRKKLKKIYSDLTVELNARLESFFIIVNSSKEVKKEIDAWETTIQNELKQLEKFSYYAKPP